MSSTDRKKYAQTANSPGWKLVNNRWLWWDGSRYTAEWDGTSLWAIEPPKLKTYKPLKPGWTIALILLGILVLLGLAVAGEGM